MTPACVRCGHPDPPNPRRGMCPPCYRRCWRADSLADFGYVKADRMADYAWLRRDQVPVPVAASRVGVTERTAWRYEAERNRVSAPVTQEARRAAA